MDQPLQAIQHLLGLGLEKHKFTAEQFHFAENIRRQYVQQGDIILTQSEGLFYEWVRQHYGLTYDHVAIVIDEYVCLHISYPSIRCIATNILLMQHRRPQLLRLDGLLPSTIDALRESLQDHYDKHYDWRHLLDLVLQKTRAKPLGREQNRFQEFLKRPCKNICSELVMWQLCRHQDNLRNTVANNIFKMDFRLVESFSPDDFMRTAQSMGSPLKIVHVPELVFTDAKPDLKITLARTLTTYLTSIQTAAILSKALRLSLQGPHRTALLLQYLLKTQGLKQKTVRTIMTLYRVGAEPGIGQVVGGLKRVLKKMDLMNRRTSINRIERARL